MITIYEPTITKYTKSAINAIPPPPPISVPIQKSIQKSIKKTYNKKKSIKHLTFSF